MLVGDLHDLEREMAKLNTDMFETTGLSYSRFPIEDAWAARPMPDRDTAQEVVFPSQTASIFSRIEDRRKLLGRLMERSPSWEGCLTETLGDESPWKELADKSIPFINPIMLEALYDDDVDGDDVQLTPSYRELHPWFWNDLDEDLVAQWHHDLTGLPLWGGSWQQYRISAGKLDPDTVPAFRDIRKRIYKARIKRATLFGEELFSMHQQLTLFQGEECPER